MKFTKLFVLISLFLNSNIFAQNRSFNLYQIGKGEIFKTDYDYLEPLNYNLFSATKLGQIKQKNNSIIININEKEVLTEKYRGISFVVDSIIKISNGEGWALFTIDTNRNDILLQKSNFNCIRINDYAFNNQAFATSGRVIFLSNKKELNTGFIDSYNLGNYFLQVKDWNYKWGVLDSTGKQIFPYEYNEIKKLNDTLWEATFKDKKVMLKANGTLMFPFYINDITFLKDKLIVNKYNSSNKIDSFLIKNYNKAEINIKNNKTLVSQKHINNETDFKNWGKSGVFDLNGNVIIPFKYDYVMFDSSGNFIVRFKNKSGVINENDKLVTPIAFDIVTCHFNSLYCVSKNNVFGIIDKNGFKILDTKYQSIFITSTNSAFVKINNKWLLMKYNINKTISLTPLSISSNSEFEYSYDNLEKKLCKDLFKIKNDDKEGLINPTGLIIILPKFKSIFNCNSLYYSCTSYNNLEGISLYNSKGKKLNTSQIDEINTNNENKKLILISQNGKWGAMNPNGDILIPMIYKSITFTVWNPNLAVVEK